VYFTRKAIADSIDRYRERYHTDGTPRNPVTLNDGKKDSETKGKDETTGPSNENHPDNK